MVEKVYPEIHHLSVLLV